LFYYKINRLRQDQHRKSTKQKRISRMGAADGEPHGDVAATAWIELTDLAGQTADLRIRYVFGPKRVCAEAGLPQCNRPNQIHCQGLG
jgi:hypothetical protein